MEFSKYIFILYKLFNGHHNSIIIEQKATQPFTSSVLNGDLKWCHNTCQSTISNINDVSIISSYPMHGWNEDEVRHE